MDKVVGGNTDVSSAVMDEVVGGNTDVSSAVVVIFPLQEPATTVLLSAVIE